MRGYQLIGWHPGTDLPIDPANNKFYVVVPPYNYKSDSTMGTQLNRKVDLFCPPTHTKLLEIYMILTAAGGSFSSTTSLAFKFNIVDFTSGFVSSTVATVDPTTLVVQKWKAIFDVRYDQAPTISAGQYLQAEFTGYNGNTNTWGCNPFWRIGVAA